MQTGAEADSKRGWGNFVSALQQHLSSRGTSDGGAKPANPAAAAVARLSATAAATGCAGLQTAAEPAWDIKKESALVGGVLLLLLLLVLVVLLLLGMRGIVHELQQLNAVLKAMSEAAANAAKVCKES